MSTGRFIAKSLGSILSLSLIFSNTLVLADGSVKKAEQPKLQKCSETQWICFTPFVRTKTILSSGSNLTDLNYTNLGGTLSSPNHSFYVTVKGSIVPFVLYGSTKSKADDTVGAKVEESHELLESKLHSADLAAQAQIKGQLAKAGIPEGTPTYTATYNKYYGVAQKQLEDTRKGKTQLINQGEARALGENNRRLDTIQLQDALQEVVLGFDNGTVFFKVGKFRAGTELQQDVNLSEMESNVAAKSAVIEGGTQGFARGNISGGVRNIQLPYDVKVSIVAWAGKNGRLYYSATQDVTNALRMSDDEFNKDARLVDFNAFGGKLKFDFGTSGNQLTLTAISNKEGMSGGAEARIQITPELIAHVAYLYAQKAGIKGNQVRAQIEKHLGQALTAEWTLAFYGEHVEGMKSYDQLDEHVDGDGRITRDTFGAAISAEKKVIFDITTRAILDVSYSQGKVDNPMIQGSPATKDEALVDDGAKVMFSTIISWN